MAIGSCQNILAENDDYRSIKLQDQLSSRVDHAKSLCVVTDDRLSWFNRVDEICRKVSSTIGVLGRVKPLISESTAILVYNTLIQTHFECRSFVWDEQLEQFIGRLVY